ncbi:MAG: hypothetical protein NXH82_14505 [Rhodobacteraceae bacterium]|nr:hypothetical protein [Paracoccaceae bacterium]
MRSLFSVPFTMAMVAGFLRAIQNIWLQPKNPEPTHPQGMQPIKKLPHFGQPFKRPARGAMGAYRPDTGCPGAGNAAIAPVSRR